MKRLKYGTIFILLIVVASLTFAKNNSCETKKCSNLFQQQEVAYSTKDWTKLKGLANQFINSCGSELSQTNSVNFIKEGVYFNLAQAYIHLGDFPKALLASKKCIDTFYSDPDCHLIKAKALIKLNRLNAASTALTDTKELIEIRIKDLKQIINDMTNYQSRDLSIRGLIVYTNMQREVVNLQKVVSSKKEKSWKLL